MATRTLAVASAGSGGAGAGACPAAARSRACVSWAATSASLSPPTTSAPRSGALADAGCVTGAGAGGAVTATDVAPLSPALGFAACRAAGPTPSPAGPLTTLAAGMSAPAKLRWSVVSYLPGTYSSTTAWKLVPPKPKALTPPRRTPPGGTVQSRSSVFTWNGEVAQSTFGFGSRKFKLGGRTFSCTAIVSLNSPAVPAAAFRWPMLDFTEPSAIEPVAIPSLPNTEVRL